MRDRLRLLERQLDELRSLDDRRPRLADDVAVDRLRSEPACGRRGRRCLLLRERRRHRGTHERRDRREGQLRSSCGTF